MSWVVAAAVMIFPPLLLWYVVRRRRRTLQTDVWSSKGGEDQFEIVWDPSKISPEGYASLVVAIGDLVRSRGGTGIRRVRSRGVVNEDRPSRDVGPA
jgi:hypothetical protein